ncbi:hypothetical protein TKK_0000297 [Trichogramma kaykai]
MVKKGEGEPVSVVGIEMSINACEHWGENNEKMWVLRPGNRKIWRGRDRFEKTVYCILLHPLTDSEKIQSQNWPISNYEAREIR